MQEVALLTDADKKNEKTDDYVSLMTIHMAKGLEFPYVFLVGLEENLFPSMQSLSAREDLEEERRLFYVAITRAMKRLTLSYAESRYKWGNLTFCEPSRFLEEINEKYLDIPKKSPVRTAEDFRSNPKLSSDIIKPPARKNLKKLNQTGNRAISSEAQDIIEKLQTGMEVEHSKFGKGKVIHVEGSGSSKKATIYFPGAGRKNLLLKFAKLNIIE
jgi:DNA helicase-2/ATP-dependent DNA helicase PcrA